MNGDWVVVVVVVVVEGVVLTSGPWEDKNQIKHLLTENVGVYGEFGWLLGFVLRSYYRTAVKIFDNSVS